ncbi:MAG: hypothetical protein AABZ60_14615, partial [Planctomycetota bacterium]
SYDDTASDTILSSSKSMQVLSIEFEDGTLILSDLNGDYQKSLEESKMPKFSEDNQKTFEKILGASIPETLKLEKAEENSWTFTFQDKFFSLTKKQNNIVISAIPLPNSIPETKK